MPGERVGWGRLKGEGEEWQLGACPSYGWWAGTSLGQLQLIQHVFEFQLVRHLSLGIGRNDMGVGSPSFMGVRLVVLCIANSIRYSLISK